MTFVLAISGKKQSGKTTLLNGLLPYFESQGMTAKEYSFADPIKAFLIDAMGIRPEQVYGTDEEKNSLTKYKWENCPDYIRWEFGGRWFRPSILSSDLKQYENTERPDWSFSKILTAGGHVSRLKTGHMSARELMQVFGTDICRRMFSPSIWVDATFAAIQKEALDVAIIPDMRFPSEMAGVQNNNGVVVRLTRDVSMGDKHPSETALDDFDWDSYSDIVNIVPHDASIEEVREIAISFINKVGLVRV